MRRCRGYGDKLRCPVTSIWGRLGLVCRVPLEVICCRISDGLEMGLEREFMPPITERKRRVTPNACGATKQLTPTPNAARVAAGLPSCCTAANEKKKKKPPSKYQWVYTVYLTARHNSAAQTLSLTDTRSAAALHRATAARGAVMEANVGELTATQGGLNKDRAAPAATTQVNGDMT